MDTDAYTWSEQGYPTDEPAVAFDEYTVPLRTVELPETSAPESSAPEGDIRSRMAGYEIPVTPGTGWSAAPSRRRFWIGRALILGVLFIQAALSLRLGGTADEGEAVSLVVGHNELQHLLHGTPVTTDLVHQMSGAPWLYPVLAGYADSLDGLAGARLLSLLFSLAGTAVLYSLSRRLFNERVAVCGAGAYAVLQSTVIVGFYASSDAMAVFLVALAAWIIVYTDRSTAAAVLLAAPVAALAVGTEYASALALPGLIALAVLASWPHRGLGGGLLRGLLLAVGSLGLLFALGSATHALTGMSTGTLARHQGTETVGSILWDAAQWSGLFLAVALAGGASYIRRERMNEVPDAEHQPSSRAQRTLLVLALCATAVIVPCYQAQLHSSTAMYRHIGLGLLFAAPLAGLGVTRLVGAHFRQPQLGILVWVLMLALGVSQSTHSFQSRPDTNQLLVALRQHTNDKGRYLTEVDGLPEYYLSDITSAGQWTSAKAGVDYRDSKGVRYRGAAGEVAAARDGWFDVIVLDSGSPIAQQRSLVSAVTGGGHYRLLAQLPYRSSTGASRTYQIYLKG